MLEHHDLKALHGWEHIQKFVLGNVEAELALSSVLLDAIVLGKRIAAEEAEKKRVMDQQAIRDASEKRRASIQPSHAATATPAKQS